MATLYENDDQRQQAYYDERQERWNLERVLIEPIARLICSIVSTNVGKPVTYEKYAESLIASFCVDHPGQPVSDKIRGAPDLLLNICQERKYVELKIKKHRFRKTIYGGKDVTAYGCKSHYLDINPVYTNILKHAQAYNIAHRDIILVYAVNQEASTTMQMPLNEKEWEFECISLEHLKSNIEARRYQAYGQGYGQMTWLIRCDDMQCLQEIFR